MSPSPVREWDTDHYFLKWANCFAVYPNGEALEFGKIIHINNLLAKIIRAKDNEEVTVPSQVIYWRYKSMFFKTNLYWYLLTRRTRRVYKVGITTENFDLMKYSSKTDTFTLMENMTIPIMKHYPAIKPAKYNLEAARKTFGAISPKIFVGKENVYFLKDVIGWRQKNKLILMNKELIPDIQSIVRDHFQVTSL